MSDKYAEQAQNLYDEIKHELRVARALDKIAAALRQAAADATRTDKAEAEAARLKKLIDGMAVGMLAIDREFGEYHTPECDVAHDVGNNCICFNHLWRDALAALADAGNAAAGDDNPDGVMLDDE